jgi:hypothetical protein
MRSLSNTHRRAVVAALAVAVAAMVLFSNSSSATTTPKSDRPEAGKGIVAAAPVAVDPVPPDPSPPATTKSATPSAKTTTAKPSLAPVPTAKSTSRAPVAPVTPALSAKDKEAKQIAEWWWDVFVIAIKKTDGLKLTSEQLRRPELKVVEKASCTQPATNMLGPKSRKSLTYCQGKLEFVPKVFRTITDEGKVRVVASGFLYHALDTAPASQLKDRSKMELLGYLQARLSLALVEYTATTSPEASWAVISPVGSAGEAVDLGYVRGVEDLEG